MFKSSDKGISFHFVFPTPISVETSLSPKISDFKLPDNVVKLIVFLLVSLIFLSQCGDNSSNEISRGHRDSIKEECKSDPDEKLCGKEVRIKFKRDGHEYITFEIICFIVYHVRKRVTETLGAEVAQSVITECIDSLIIEPYIQHKESTSAIYKTKPKRTLEDLLLSSNSFEALLWGYPDSSSFDIIFFKIKSLTQQKPKCSFP